MDFNISSLSFSISKNSVVKNEPQQNSSDFEVGADTQKNFVSITAKETVFIPKLNNTTSLMNNAQMNLFLKDMLNLPKEWLSLIINFANINTNNIKDIEKSLLSFSKTPELMAFFQANPNIDLLALAKLISQNSNLMTNKMLKLMNGTNFDNNLINQMKEISLIGSSIAGLLNVNQNDFIRSVVQMYLPWLPFVPQEQVDTGIFDDAFENDVQNKNAQTSFYINTESIGMFKIEIADDENVEIFISRQIDKIDDTDKELKVVLKEIANKYFNNAEFYYYSKEIELSNIKNEKQLHIISSSTTSISLLLIQMLARKIFEFDESSKISENRLSKLNNSTSNE